MGQSVGQWVGRKVVGQWVVARWWASGSVSGWCAAVCPGLRADLCNFRADGVGERRSVSDSRPLTETMKGVASNACAGGLAGAEAVSPALSAGAGGLTSPSPRPLSCGHATGLPPVVRRSCGTPVALPGLSWRKCRSG